jgi:hypothetical protein
VAADHEVREHRLREYVDAGVRHFACRRRVATSRGRHGRVVGAAAAGRHHGPLALDYEE